MSRDIAIIPKELLDAAIVRTCGFQKNQHIISIEEVAWKLLVNHKFLSINIVIDPSDKSFLCQEEREGRKRVPLAKLARPHAFGQTCSPVRLGQTLGQACSPTRPDQAYSLEALLGRVTSSSAIRLLDHQPTSPRG